jgi:predicted ATPase/class 3 adenylate cyclase/transcriptional regulator with XRE-family HTH domain
MPSDGSFRALLRHYRTAAHLTQVELAERAHLSVRGINDLERGVRTSPQSETVRLLAEALGLQGEEGEAFLAAARRRPGHSSPDVALGTVPPEGPAGWPLEPLGQAVVSLHQPLLPTPHLPSLPSGTVTFLFTDIAGSTRLLQRLRSHYAEALTTHQRLLRTAFTAHGGYEVDTQGDSFFIAFPSALEALQAAVDATRTLAEQAWPEEVAVLVRMGLHSGVPQLVGERYVGLDVHRAARIAAAGHGGQILLSAATAELVRHDLPDGVSLRDLGSHRLKDLQQPEQVYQLVLSNLPSDFPPLKAVNARPHNLPVQATPLLGREREVAAICALLQRNDVRLVTLTGPAGIGKTRLSLQVAAELLDAFPDGVWNVRLSRLTDPEQVVPAIAMILGLRETGPIPLGRLLNGYVQDKHMLLVLDNFEQIVAAAPQVAELLECCPGLVVLVTSRVPLHLQGEHEYALSPLALPDVAHLTSPERLSQYAAVALFLARAQAAYADFALTSSTAPAVAEICVRLDGLPLAIVLAAARIKVLPPPALLKQLDRSLAVLGSRTRDTEERQQTMRSTLAWSYDLLLPEEQRLFRRLAVFVGGCTLEPAEVVCIAPEGAEPLRLDLMEGVSQLVDQSLVLQRAEAGEARFSLLYVIREFALELLEASGEVEALQQAHAQWCLQLAQEAEPHVQGPQARVWLDRLEREHDNVRAALGWARSTSQTTFAMHLAATLKYYWYARGRIVEGLAWLLPALRETESVTLEVDQESQMLRAKALNTAGMLALWHDDMPLACDLLRASAALAWTTGNLGIAAEALNRLSLAVFYEGDQRQALEIMDESVELARKQTDPLVLSAALINLAYLLYHTGNFEQAAARASESLALAHQAGDLHGQTVCLMELGKIARLQGDPSRAHAILGQALHQAREVGDPRLVAETLEYFANMVAEAGEGERAARLLGAAAKVREPIGSPQMSVEQAETEALVAPVRAKMGEEAWSAAFTVGQMLSVDEAVAEALGN